jgi:monoamine oxidase
MSTSTDRQPLRVAIIGAGAAGLFASHRLRIALGSRVQIQHFEADSRCGGRVYSVRDAEFADYAVEMGAEEVHGEKSLMYRLASSCPGAEIVDRDKLLDDFYWLDGKLIDENQAYKDKDIKKLENMDDWMWTYKGADMSVADAAKQRQISQRINTFFEMEFGTEYGTDNSNLSIVYKQEVDRSWRAGEKNFVLKGASMMDVIQHTVGAEVMSSVQLNHSVSHVTFTDDKQVVVRGINSSDNSPFECIVDKVFITVSLGVLQARAIQFQPALPEALQSTIDRQGFDAGIKVTLKFNRRFWPKYMASCYGTNLIREFWACGAGKGTNSHLTGFVMGQNAKSLSERGTAGIIDAGIPTHFIASFLIFLVY